MKPSSRRDFLKASTGATGVALWSSPASNSADLDFPCCNELVNQAIRDVQPIGNVADVENCLAEL